MSEEREGVVDTVARMKDQIEQINSELNWHYTREALAAKGIFRDPTPAELAWQFILGGGADHFRRETEGKYVKS